MIVWQPVEMTISAASVQKKTPLIPNKLYFVVVFSSGQYESEDDYDLYDSNEDEDDGGLGEEYEELHSPQVRPHFTTRPQHFKIPIGHSARLPCRVQNLGKTAIQCVI